MINMIINKTLEFNTATFANWNPPQRKKMNSNYFCCCCCFFLFLFFNLFSSEVRVSEALPVLKIVLLSLHAAGFVACHEERWDCRKSWQNSIHSFDRLFHSMSRATSVFAKKLKMTRTTGTDTPKGLTDFLRFTRSVGDN